MSIEKKEKILRMETTMEPEKKKISSVNKMKNSIKEMGRQRIIIIVCLCASVLYAYLYAGTMGQMIVSRVLDDEGANNNQYVSFAGGYLRFGKDGMALLDKSAEEIWNVAYQISNPILAQQGDSLVIGDRNGNQILVIEETGIKGEIYTGQPIEKLSVSSQGIVAAMLKSDNASEIICYDSVGNVIAEHQVSAAGMGHPLDVAISSDGKKLMVTYLQYLNGKIESSYRCYSLYDPSEMNYEKVMVEDEVEGTLFARTFFVGSENAVLIGDDKVRIIDVTSQKTLQDTSFDYELTSVVHNDEYLVLALKNDTGSNENELRVYDVNGKEKSRITYQGSYSNVKIVDNQIIMSEGNACRIFTVSGKEILDAVYMEDIEEVFPRTGINKYLVIDRDKVANIRLKR